MKFIYMVLLFNVCLVHDGTLLKLFRYPGSYVGLFKGNVYIYIGGTYVELMK